MARSPFRSDDPIEIARRVAALIKEKQEAHERWLREVCDAPGHTEVGPVVFGDPPPGRSALAQKQREQSAPPKPKRATDVVATNGREHTYWLGKLRGRRAKVGKSA